MDDMSAAGRYSPVRKALREGCSPHDYIVELGKVTGAWCALMCLAVLVTVVFAGAGPLHWFWIYATVGGVLLGPAVVNLPQAVPIEKSPVALKEVGAGRELLIGETNFDVAAVYGRVVDPVPLGPEQDRQALLALCQQITAWAIRVARVEQRHPGESDFRDEVHQELEMWLAQATQLADAIVGSKTDKALAAAAKQAVDAELEANAAQLIRDDAYRNLLTRLVAAHEGLRAAAASAPSSISAKEAEVARGVTEFLHELQQALRHEAHKPRD